MSMNWAIGFAVGLAVAAALVGIVKIIILKRTGVQRRGAYDERQQLARGKAYTAAYATLLIYLAVWMIFRSVEVPFFMESLSVVLGALLSIAVFVGYSVFHDAYFKASESPKSWIGIICAIGAVNLGIGALHLIRGETLTERLYDNVNLFVGLLMAVTLVCLVIKRAMDRRSEAE